MKPSTRKKRPIPAVMDQVRITRDGNDAIIEYADPMIADTRLTIGPQINGMTDKDIIDVFNGVMAAQEKLLGGWARTVTEMMPGAPQIEYRKDLDQIVPLAEVDPLLRRRWWRGRRGDGAHRRQRAVVGRIRATPQVLCRLGDARDVRARRTLDREPHSGSTATQEITKALRHKVFCMIQGGANAVGGSCVSSTPR